MPTLREIKNRARRDLHAKAQVPALYISPLQNSQPRLVTIRLHTKFGNTGLLGRDNDWAETRDIKPRIISMRNQLALPRNMGIFSIAEFEAYRVDLVEPHDGITTTSVCTRMKREETVSLPYPLGNEDAPAPIPNPNPGSPDPGTGAGGRFTFPFLTPASEWYVKHNLGYLPSVQLLDMDGNEFYAKYTNIDKNNLVVGPLNPSMNGSVILR